MSSPEIALLDASHNHPDTPRNFQREIPAPVTVFDVTSGEFPDPLAYDGIVISGSRASVYWDEPWISDTLDFIREAADAGVPMLGICWGHQAIAAALGGTVEPMDAYEIGYKTVQRTVPDAAILDGLGDEFTVFETHSDAVTEPPPEATVLAVTDRSVQAFELPGTGTVGVQFHPEYDKQTARKVTSGKTDIDPDRQERALNSITEENYEAARTATQIFENFVTTLTDTSTSTGTDQSPG